MTTEHEGDAWQGGHGSGFWSLPAGVVLQANLRSSWDARSPNHAVLRRRGEQLEMNEARIFVARCARQTNYLAYLPLVTRRKASPTRDAEICEKLRVKPK